MFYFSSHWDIHFYVLMLYDQQLTRFTKQFFLSNHLFILLTLINMSYATPMVQNEVD